MENKIEIGDWVDVYIPVGDPPYEHEVRQVIKLDPYEGLAYLDDKSSVGIGYCTKVDAKTPTP